MAALLSLAFRIPSPFQFPAKEREWKNSREILIEGPGTSERWAAVDDPPNDLNLPLNARIAAACMRVLSITPSCPSATQNRWIGELVAWLAEAFHPEDMDRFVALRLVDLFSPERTQGFEELQETALDVILQFGTSTHLYYLEQRLLERGGGDFDGGLRRAFLLGLLGRAYLCEQRQTVMEFPLEKLRRERLRRFLWDRLAWILSGAGGRIHPRELGTIREQFRNWQRSQTGIDANGCRITVAKRNIMNRLDSNATTPEHLRQAIEEPMSGSFATVCSLSPVDSYARVLRDNHGAVVLITQDGRSYTGCRRPDYDPEQELKPGAVVSFSAHSKRILAANSHCSHIKSLC